MSELTGIPAYELEIVGPFKEGPDFYVYHKGKMVTIVEVKTTRISGRYPKECLDECKNQLNGYFTDDKWKGYGFRNARFGIPIAICLKDLDEIIRTDFKSGIEYKVGDIVWNPNPGS